MEVILLSHIKNLGQKGQTIKVSDGYFQNFLLPRGLAQKATVSQVQHIKAQQEKAVEKLENMKESATTIQSRLDGRTAEITEKASEVGKLYAAIREKELRQAILNELKVDVPEKLIQLKEPLKTTGAYTVTIKLFKDITATVNILVKAS